MSTRLCAINHHSACGSAQSQFPTLSESVIFFAPRLVLHLQPENPEVAGVAAEIAATAASIAKVDGQIEAVVEEERALRRDQPSFWREDLNRLITKEEQLRTEKGQLRKKEEQLRVEKEQLRKKEEQLRSK